MGILLCGSSLLFAQKEMSDVVRGNRAYSDENYTEAEVNYRRGLDKNNVMDMDYFKSNVLPTIKKHIH